jgi:hypothetical protein
VKGEVRQLVSKRARQIGLVGTEQDGALAGLGNGRTPGRCPARGERIEHAAIGHEDEAECTRISTPEARPLGRAVGGAGQVEGNRPLCRPGDNGDPTDLDGGRGALEQQDER